MVMIMFTPDAATIFGESTAVALPKASSLSTDSLTTSNTTSSWPALSRLRAIGAPMWPRPINPSFIQTLQRMERRFHGASGFTQIFPTLRQDDPFHLILVRPIRVDLCSPLFQADGGVYPACGGLVVKPPCRDRLGLGIELHHLLTIGSETAQLGPTRASETEEGHRHRDRHVDADLADVDLILELARRGTALGEDAGAVAEGILVDDVDGLVQRVDADDDQHRAEDLAGVHLHVRCHAREDRRADEVARLIAGHLDVAAVQIQPGAFLHPVLNEAEDAVPGVLGDDRPDIRAFLRAGVDLEA